VQAKKRGPKRKERGRWVGPAAILFQDRDLLVLDKPAGLLAVPIPGSRAVNLKDLVDGHLAPFEQRAGVVHRIDRYTSGVMVFARNPEARASLVEQFRGLTPERVYWALVRGRVDPAEGELRHALKLTPHGFRQVVVDARDPEGKEAVTRYRVLESLAGVTLLEVRLVTGLKNQIRVQLCAAGHPLVGDRHYAPAEKAEPGIDRQALHARSLAFRHPRTGERVRFEAPLPPDLQRLLRAYGAPAA